MAEDAYWFFQAFFKTYTEYQQNPLYIIGESYAGHYVPAITHRIHQGNQESKPNTIQLPLSGLAIGNGLTNPELQYPWYPEMVWNNSHHIQVVSEEVYEGMLDVVPHCTKLISECNAGDGMINTFACQSAFVLCNMGLTYVFQFVLPCPRLITIMFSHLFMASFAGSMQFALPGHRIESL